jgi:hypothetical protein
VDQTPVREAEFVYPSKKNLDESQFEILEVWSGCHTKV